jgi:hypothetical protein
VGCQFSDKLAGRVATFSLFGYYHLCPENGRANFLRIVPTYLAKNTGIFVGIGSDHVFYILPLG